MSRSRLDELKEVILRPRHFDERIAQSGEVVTEECAMLMQEYLRREALWAKRLDIENALPFPNLPAVIGAEKDYASSYGDAIQAFVVSPFERECCGNMLNWYSFHHNHPDVIESFELPDPYLPLLRIWSKGGFFSTEHRVNIDINQKIGVHAGIVQSGALEKPFANPDEETI